MSPSKKQNNEILDIAEQAAGRLRQPQQQQGQESDGKKKQSQQGDGDGHRIARTGFEQAGGM